MLPLPSPDHIQLLLKQERYEEVFEVFLPQVSDKSSTRANVLSGWRLYASWLQAHDQRLLHFNQPEVDYVAWLQRQYPAPSTVNNRLYQVRKLYDLLLAVELIERNPFQENVGCYNPFIERREVYSNEDISKLMAQANAEEKLLILLATQAGLSAGEVSQLKYSDILGGGKQLHVRRVRYRKEGFNPEQVVGTTTELQHALEQWLKEHGDAPLYQESPQGHVFQAEGKPFTPRQLLSTLYFLCKRANVTYKPWRALRHAAGVQKLAQGIDSEQVQLVLGVERLTPLARKAGVEDGRKRMWMEGGKRRKA